MKTTIYIPVVDTEKYNFDYDKELSVSEYDDMVYDHFMKNNKKVDRGMRDMIDNSMRRQRRYYSDYELYDVTEDEGYRVKPSECDILDTNSKSIEMDFLIPYILNRKMFIVILDVKPLGDIDSIDGDIQSEMKFWIRDSNALLNDKDIDDKTKIKALPKTHFDIFLDKKLYRLKGCRLIEMYKEEKHPYKFAVLVEKIIEIKKHI